MPSIQCDNGKWKWGENGSCIYDSKKESDDANSDYRAISDIDFTPTQGMIDEAKKGKEWREEFGRGGTEVGLKTAKRMYSYLQRHEVDKQGEGFSPDEDGFPSAGRIAWALWGGDPAVKFSEKKATNQIRNWCVESKRKRNEIIAEEEKDERNLKNYNQMEKRIFNIETRVDSTEDGRDLVVGHASVYDSRSNNLGGFYEFIERGAFTEELIANSDVRALINHDPNLILARNTSGTLNLTADERGLKYEFEMPETSYGKDLAISMKRGDITQSSFAFTVAEDDWSTDDEGNNIRTIKKIDRLYDISAVTYPAYNMAESDLVVAKRGLKEYQQSLVEETKEEIIEEKENNLVRNSLISLNIELKKRK
jgi:HK97 family phage prohead protease